MYRRVQERKAETGMADEQLPQLVAVTRLAKLPIVETGWHLATNIYTRIKVKSKFISVIVTPHFYFKFDPNGAPNTNS
jgi:hypothetical protein